MNLTVRIHDIEYKDKIAQGVTFSEEYNETLDSGSIRICHIGQINNLRPYDDVYIYETVDKDGNEIDFNEFIAYWRQGGELHDGDKTITLVDGKRKRLPFYRHLLVDNFAEEIVNLDAVDPISEKQGIFSYSIELFSETKGLEMVQVPNISVTQPLNMKKKVDIYTYLTRFVNLYSPKYKTLDRTASGKWKYAKKYSVAPELKEIFGGVYSQDFTLSNPTLKDVLSTLMITKDMIPYVKDNVIYAKAISERTGKYDIEAQKRDGKINMVVGQMSSADYCDGVRRQYSNALSQNGTCNFIEYLGFRNKNSAIMSFDGMNVETTHPIYKVKKVNLCYYKAATIYRTNDMGVDDKRERVSRILMFCKQDMTPLVKLNSEWEVLSQDWEKLNENPPQNIYDLAQYKLTTVTYNLGGTSIIGWSTRYKQPLEKTITVYDVEKSYIENILTYLEKFDAIGSSNTEQGIIKGFLATDYAKNTLGWKENEDEFVVIPETGIDAIYLYEDDIVEQLTTESTQKLKTLFFEIEYEGFYDGALIHSRDKGNDNLFQNDNQSSSLTLLEKDGYSQKEKLNRFANKTITMKGRLDGDNYGVENLLKLGQTGKIGNDDDVIIYRREYSIFDNYILVSYAGINDYVLKNFYTSVYARYRTNQLMSYGESTTRAETRKVMLLLSKDKKFKDEDTFFKVYDDTGKRIESELFFSMFKPRTDNVAINSAVISTIPEDEKQQKHFYVDEQTFTSGNSLCFNIAMIDNASGGNYIKKYVADYEALIERPSDDADYVVGSTQDWYNIVDDVETGFIDHLEFEVNNREITPPISTYYEDDSIRNFYAYSKNLPRADVQSNIVERKRSSMSMSEDLFKDNKEKIDMTLQIEPIVDSDIVVGEYFTRLSNLSVQDNIKRDEEIDTDSVSKYQELFKLDCKFDKFDKNEKNGVLLTLNLKANKGLTVEETKNELIDYIKSSNQTVEHMGVVCPCIDFKFAIDVFHKTTSSRFQYVTNKLAYIERPNWGGSERTDVLVLVGNGFYILNGGLPQILPEDMDKKEGAIGIEFDLGYTKEGSVPYWWWAGLNGWYFDGEEKYPKTFFCPVLLNKESSTKIKRNMFVEFNHEDYVDKTYMYTIKPYDTYDGIFYKYKKVSEIFELKGEGNDSFIRVHIPKSQRDGIKSIRYWYFDFESAYTKDYTDSEYVYDYHPSQSGYRFVFGVNVTAEELHEDSEGNAYVDIYITKTTHRDERVFDSVGRQVGLVHNCVNDLTFPETQPVEQLYDDNKEDTLTAYSVDAEVNPENSGIVEGGGIYYDGEIATLTFTPNGGNVFYRWRAGEDFISTNNVLTIAVDSDMKFIAQCGVEYNIFYGLSPATSISSHDTDVVLYQFKPEQKADNIVKITAAIRVTGRDILNLPVSYVGSFDIDTVRNINEDTASNATIVADFGSVTLKVWFDYRTNTIHAKGYKTTHGNKTQKITINIEKLDAVFIEKPQTRLTLDFSDGNIESIVVINDTKGTRVEYSKPSDSNQIVLTSNGVGDSMFVFATAKDGYDSKYTDSNKLDFEMGVDMLFAPEAEEEGSSLSTSYYTLWESEDGELLREDGTFVLLSGLDDYIPIDSAKSTTGMKFTFNFRKINSTLPGTTHKEKITDGETIHVGRGFMFTSNGLRGLNTGTALYYNLNYDKTEIDSEYDSPQYEIRIKKIEALVIEQPIVQSATWEQIDDDGREWRNEVEVTIQNTNTFKCTAHFALMDADGYLAHTWERDINGLNTKTLSQSFPEEQQLNLNGAWTLEVYFTSESVDESSVTTKFVKSV